MYRKLAVAAALALSVPVAAQAQTYDAYTSFNASQGAGNFYYGTSPDTGTGFSLFAATSNCFIDGSICLQQAANHDVPGVTKSTTTSFQYNTVNVPDDRLLLHPGADGQITAAIFLTPASGQYRITASFNVQDLYPTGVNVYLLTNPGNTLPYTLTPLTLLDGSNPSGSYSATMFLNSSDLVGFAFDDAGLYYNDSIGFNFSVAAVPETTTWAMLLGGFVMLGGAMRMRRRRLALA
jgi:hypothetical protein